MANLISSGSSNVRSLPETLLCKSLSRLVRRGTLSVALPSGAQVRFGDGSEPKVAIRLADQGSVLGLMTDPDLQLGELFMDGRLIVEEGTIFDFLQVVLQDARETRPSLTVQALDRIRFALRRFAQRNGLTRARTNVAHHYNLNADLYALFLDSDWQYSCAYFEDEQTDLDEAQLAKKRHIAAKLLVKPQDRILDIGCGWGGLARYLADTAGAAHVTGITLSEEQLGLARQRAEARGLSDRVSFELTDYRVAKGQFDKIVSVGMFEHVGVDFYDTFFGACRKLIKDDGVMLLHFIGNSDVPDFTNPWIARYIFPGGHIPSLSEVMPAIERAGLVVTDIEILRLHYARTLRAWRERFMARRDEALRVYDERFCRMWEFYLAFSEAAFRWQDIAIFQIQLAPRQENVPLTRDYIARSETVLRERERADIRAGAVA